MVVSPNLRFFVRGDAEVILERLFTSNACYRLSLPAEFLGLVFPSQAAQQIRQALRDIGYRGGVHVELSRHSHMAVEAVRAARACLAPLAASLCDH